MMFVGSELGHCSYHLQEPKFTSGSNIGNYQCCQQKAVRFDTSIKKKGCCSKFHQVKPEVVHSKEYELIMKNFTVLEEPFDVKIDGKNGLNRFVQQYIRNKETGIFGDEDEDDEEEEEESKVVEEEVKEAKKNLKPKGKANDLNPTKQRIWKLDNLRLDDYKKMKDISMNLVKMRKKEIKKGNK